MLKLQLGNLFSCQEKGRRGFFLEKNFKAQEQQQQQQ